MPERPHVVVIGGGVIGISTAIALLDHPSNSYDVTLIAADLPFDSSSSSPLSSPPSSYASAWAGAHHVSDANNAEQLKRDKVTFETLRRLESKGIFGEDALVWVHQVEYWERKEDVNHAATEWYPNYCLLPSSALPEGTAFGCTFSTYDIVVPQYLPKLYQIFLSLGGKAILKKVNSIDHAIEYASKSIKAERRAQPSAAIVSPGLGAIELLNDQDVHPVRGQTLLIEAPWCTTDSCPAKLTSELTPKQRETVPRWLGMSRVNKDKFRDMYILPRGDGTFIVGGTRLANDWDTKPREETSREILQRVLLFQPGLARYDDDHSSNDILRKVSIERVNVGLRPARKGGVRLEDGGKKGEVQIIYSYGYGGFGYQCSWGAAFEARDLLDDTLRRPRASSGSMLATLDK